MDRERIVAWMKARNLNNRQLAEKLEISEDKVSKALSTKRKPRRWQADEALKLVKLMEEGDDVVRTEVRGTGMSADEVKDAWSMPGKSKPVPLLGTARGGDWEGLEDIEMTELRLSEVLDYIARPSSLADDIEAYAVEIVGDSMWPRFEPGERVYVSPKAAVRSNDDVIIQLRNASEPEGSDVVGAVTEVLIKRLVRQTASYVELRQFHPDRTFRVPIDRIARFNGKLAMHRVRGRL